MAIEYNRAAEEYARHRGVSLPVLGRLLQDLRPGACVLDVGCGTGNYLRALSEHAECELWGVEPSQQMLERARANAPSAVLKLGSAERLDVPDRCFDLVITVDVIHHLVDRDAFFREAGRVLRPDGWLCVVTDSHDDIPRRRPLSSHFPETVATELRRYPSIPELHGEMRRAGLRPDKTESVETRYRLESAAAYRDRAFSALHMLDDATFQSRLADLEAEIAAGPIDALAPYTAVWATPTPVNAGL